MGVKSTPHSGRFTTWKRFETVYEAGWAPGAFWTGAESLAHTGIRSPDLPACSESLYRLSCSGFPIKDLQLSNLELDVYVLD
jgi:hypothetical protein